MILALRMVRRKPFEFVVYPRVSAVGFLARLPKPRSDRSVTYS
jgi:ABC-type transporter Mla maintaining outer membrane lipid asymmetry permease subunit MlaE